MSKALTAGIAYFAIIFGLGFLLGTVRVLLLAPRLGDNAGTLIELPIMLAVSWHICGWLMDAFKVPPARQHRLIMGAVAFALLMIAELCLSMVLFGRSLIGHLETYRSSSALLGLAGQFGFAAMPLIRQKPGSAIL